MFTTSIDGGVLDISLSIFNIAGMATKSVDGVVFIIGRWLRKDSMVMALFLNMGAVMGTPHSLICVVGSGETMEGDKIILLLYAFSTSSLIRLSSSISPRHSQNSFESPMQLAFVAASLYPFALHEQSPDTWSHPPCVQQYRSVCLRTKLALSGVLRIQDVPPFLSPLPLEPLRLPEPP